MDALQAILTRKVVRKYSSRPVSLEQIEQLVEAGRHAMSAMNRQPWSFVIVRQPQILRELGALTPHGQFIAEVPAAIVVLKTLEGRFSDEDCAQAVQNIANAAWAMGLGTCRPGVDNEARIGELLGLPAQAQIFTIMPIGYPDESSPPEGRPLKKRGETTYHERFGQTRP